MRLWRRGLEAWVGRLEVGTLGEVVYEVVVVVVGMNAHVEVFECFEDLEWVGRSGSTAFGVAP